MDKFFAVLGKGALVIVFIAALAGGGYYLGTSGKINFGTSQKPEAVTTTNPTPEPTTIETTLAPTTTSSPVKTKIVTAGVTAGSGLSFARFSVDVPEDWGADHTSDAAVPTDSLTLTKGDYQIKIYQAASGGAQCLYPGDPTPDHPFVNTYDTYTEITTKDGLIFRSSASGGVKDGKLVSTVCQKSEGGTYGAPTTYGHMTVTAPASATSAMIDEIRSIIASLRKS